jgi:ribose transport system permease protein
MLQAKGLKNIYRNIIKIPEITILIPVILLSIFAVIFTETFFALKNIISIIRNISSIGIVSIFMTMLLMSRGLDLSSDAVAALIGVVFAFLLVKLDLPLGVVIICVIAIAVIVGLLNSIFILRLGIPSIIATLGMLYIGKGLSTVIAGGSYIVIDRQFAIYDFKIFGITIDVFIFIGIAVISDLVLRFTTFGRKVKLIGINANAAKISGINTIQITSILYILTALGAGFASLLFSMRSRIGTIDAGTSWALQAISACVIGGTSLFGGKGSILGTVLGVIFMGIVTNLMILLGIKSEWQYVGIGLFMLLGILLGVYREKIIID